MTNFRRTDQRSNKIIELDSQSGDLPILNQTSEETIDRLVPEELSVQSSLNQRFVSLDPSAMRNITRKANATEIKNGPKARNNPTMNISIKDGK